MKTMITASLLLFASVSSYAGCVGTQQAYNQYCAVVTDQSECQQLTGMCQWQAQTSANLCTGQNEMCGLLDDESDCAMLGCNWK